MRPIVCNGKQNHLNAATLKIKKMLFFLWCVAVHRLDDRAENQLGNMPHKPIKDDAMSIVFRLTVGYNLQVLGVNMVVFVYVCIFVCVIIIISWGV